MPKKSLPLSVNTWPDQQEVDRALRAWARRQTARRPEILRLGYFGSYARGDWGPGSDVDILVVVAHSELPFLERPRQWDVSRLPVPADLLIYTEKEWQSLPADSRFVKTINREIVWLDDALGRPS